jgi:hypothetical protein
VSQPFDRGCEVPAPAKLDESLDEFWSSNPFKVSNKHNLSGYERNRTYLNVDGRNFVDISYITGTDSDGDGRSVVPMDINHDGRQDLVVRQAGGGPIKLYKNEFPQKHWLKVSLRGVQSNRLGIGARLVVTAGERKVVRELYPANTYFSQAPALVHFGLGDAASVDNLTIRWPSGKEQKLGNLAADRHIIIREGEDVAHTITPGQPIKLTKSAP